MYSLICFTKIYSVLTLLGTLLSIVRAVRMKRGLPLTNKESGVWEKAGTSIIIMQGRRANFLNVHLNKG